MKYGYGWIPDVPDRRDFFYKARKPRRLRLPNRVDETCSKIENQGVLGSCTAQALADDFWTIRK